MLLNFMRRELLYLLFWTGRPYTSILLVMGQCDILPAWWCLYGCISSSANKRGLSLNLMPLKLCVAFKRVLTLSSKMRKHCHQIGLGWVVSWSAVGKEVVPFGCCQEIAPSNLQTRHTQSILQCIPNTHVFKTCSEELYKLFLNDSSHILSSMRSELLRRMSLLQSRDLEGNNESLKSFH